MVYDLEDDGIELARISAEIKKCQHELTMRRRETFTADARKKIVEIQSCSKCLFWSEKTVWEEPVVNEWI